jgi:hypothetical protein
MMLAALALSMTPTAVLCMSTLSSSGPETAAGIAVWVGLLAVTEPGARRRDWLFLLAAGLVLAVTRPTGPLWLLVMLAVVAVFLRGFKATASAVRRGGRVAGTAIGIVLIGVAVAVVWQLTQQPAYPTTIAVAPLNAGTFGTLLYNLVGTVGWGELEQPHLIVSVWAALDAVLVMLAIIRAARLLWWRSLAALLALTGGTLLLIAGFLVYGSHTGVVQGRWFEAIFAGVPILAGWILTMPASAGATTRSRGYSLDLLAPPFVLIEAVGLLAAWWYSVHRYAVGLNGRLLFFLSPTWQPPFGWLPWLLAAGVGLVCLVLASVSPLGPLAQGSNAAA